MNSTMDISVYTLPGQDRTFSARFPARRKCSLPASRLVQTHLWKPSQAILVYKAAYLSSYKDVLALSPALNCILYSHTQMFCTVTSMLMRRMTIPTKKETDSTMVLQAIRTKK